MSEEIKVLGVGVTKMSVMSEMESDIIYAAHDVVLEIEKYIYSFLWFSETEWKNIFIRKLDTLKQKYPNESITFHKMSEILESCACILDAHRQQWEKGYKKSSEIQKIISDCGGFITFKEFIAMYYKQDINLYEQTDEDVLIRIIANDKTFPENADASWKSYRAILKYILNDKKENYTNRYGYRVWQLKNMFSEYQAIIEGRYFPCDSLSYE